MIDKNVVGCSECGATIRCSIPSDTNPKVLAALCEKFTRDARKSHESHCTALKNEKFYEQESIQKHVLKTFRERRQDLQDDMACAFGFKVLKDLSSSLSQDKLALNCIICNRKTILSALEEEQLRQGHLWYCPIRQSDFNPLRIIERANESIESRIQNLQQQRFNKNTALV